MEHDAVAWDIEVTSGMVGRGIDKEFIASLSNNEIDYLFEQVEKVRNMLFKEVTERSR